MQADDVIVSNISVPVNLTGRFTGITKNNLIACILCYFLLLDCCLQHNVSTDCLPICSGDGVVLNLQDCSKSVPGIIQCAAGLCELARKCFVNSEVNVNSSVV